MNLRLPRTQTTLTAVLLLSAAPFALAQTPPGAGTAGAGGSPAVTAPGASTPGVTPPGTTTPGATVPGGASPGMNTPGAANPQSTSPGAAPQATSPGATYPNGTASQNMAPGTRNGQYNDQHSGEHNGQYNGQSRTRNGMSAGASNTRQAWGNHRMSLRVPRKDIHAAKNAKVSLTQAIETARRRHHGEVISARFELRQGKPEYLIRTFDSQRHSEWLTHVDARTGKLLGKGRTIPLSRVPQTLRQQLTASNSPATTLEQAVHKAERQRGGKAVAAGLSAKNGSVSYRTELLKKNGQTQMAMISPSSGQVSRYR